MSQEKLNIALFAAVQRHATIDVIRLLDNGADANARNEKDETPLHIAAAANNLAEAQILLGQGANPDAQDANDSTPLHIAVRRATPNMTLLLLSAGANPLLKNKWEKTPREWNFDPEIRSALLQAEAARRIRKVSASKAPAPGYFPE